MPLIEKLRYVRLGVADPDAAADFATRIVGLQQVDAPEGSAMFRADARDPALIVHAAGQGDDAALAVQLRDDAALDEVTGRLEAAGHAVTRGGPDDCAVRKCRRMAWIRLRAGPRIELVVRPMDSGWRYHGPRDAGIVEFFGVAFASTDVAADTELWTEILGGKVADWLGDAVYIALDDQHHRIAIHPSERDAILEVQFRVEGLHQLMQNMYHLQSAQVPISHGPGRRPASEQLFLTFKGPEETQFGYVAEGAEHPFDSDRLPRQFPRRAESFCNWGSTASIPEYSA